MLIEMNSMKSVDKDESSCKGTVEGRKVSDFLHVDEDSSSN